MDSKRPNDQPEDDDVQIVSLQPERTSPVPVSTHLSQRNFNLFVRVGVVVSLCLLFTLVLSNNGAMFYQLAGHWLPASWLPVQDANQIFLDANIPWVKISVDGKPLSVSNLQTLQPLTLTNGKHTIGWLAQPFKPRLCVISIPVDSNTTCQLVVKERTENGHRRTIRLLLVRQSLADLSEEMRSRLFDGVEKTLERQAFVERVEVGEHYRTTQGVVIAKEPLLATLHFRLQAFRGAGGESYITTLQGCQAVCSLDRGQLDTLALPPNQMLWMALVVGTGFWDYHTLDGRLIAQDQPRYSEDPPAQPHPVLLSISWTGEDWKMNIFLSASLGDPIATVDAVLTDDPACAAAQNQLWQLLPEAGPIRLISGADPAMGCLAIVGGNGAVKSLSARYLERFGVLIAVDDQAHTLLPQLPLVTASQQELVQQIEQIPGQVIPARQADCLTCSNRQDMK